MNGVTANCPVLLFSIVCLPTGLFVPFETSLSSSFGSNSVTPSRLCWVRFGAVVPWMKANEPMGQYLVSKKANMLLSE